MTRDLTRAVLNEITSRGFTCSDGDSPGTFVLTPSQDPETSASGTPAHTILTLPLKELHEVVEALGGVQWFVDTLLEGFCADATGATTYITVSGSPAGVHSRWRLAPGLRTDAAARDAVLSALHDRGLHTAPGADRDTFWLWDPATEDHTAEDHGEPPATTGEEADSQRVKLRFPLARFAARVEQKGGVAAVADYIETELNCHPSHVVTGIGFRSVSGQWFTRMKLSEESRELSRRARKGERFVWTDEPESFSG